MSILKGLIKEMAAGGATGAGAIAGAHGSLFKGGVVRRNRKRKMKEAYRFDPEKVAFKKPQNSWKWKVLGEMFDSESFDSTDVMSKLDAAEKRAKNEEDTVPFGLEDEEGNIVKVYVRADQADEFESALGSMLAGADEDQDEDNSAVEIAEVLFQLKDKFDIVDVQWHNIEGDEEEEQEVGADEMDMGEEGDLEGGDEMDDLEGGDEELDLGGEEGDLEGGDEMGDLEGGDMEMEPEGGAESALQQVIDMMKADAEARKAESEARAKEAEARAAEANASAASAKVKQEEQVLDMETFNDEQKAEEEEAKRLAKLAKYQHQKAQKAETMMGAEEEEIGYQGDQQEKTQPISVQALADELIRRLSGATR